MSRELSGSFVAAVALGAAAALGGCFADAPADDTADPGAEPSPPSGRAADTLADVLGGDPPPAVVHGTYRVPVPDDLAPFSVYELDEASVEIVDGTLHVSFLLPEGLLGFSTVATFVGPVTPGAEIAVSGLMGHGTCRFDGNVECALAYYAVETDLAAVTAYWRARGDAFVDARVQVASLFDDDPLGVLRLSVE
jgi:hypothetical protein